MAQSQYLYQVAVDTGSTLRAAQNVRQVFQREMSQITTSFSGAGGAVGNLAGQVGGGLSRGMFGGVGGLLAGGVSGLIANFTLQSAGQMAQFANQIKSGEQALVGFSGSAAAAEARIEAIQNAAGGAITRFDALRIANQGAALGFGQTSGELERVTALASQVSTVFGGTLSSNIENMAAAAANLSFVRLDTLGISADETRKRFEELRGELGDTAAFMQAMLEVGERTYRNIEAQATGVSRLSAAWADLRATAATAAEPSVDFIAGEAAQSLRGIELIIEYYNRATEAQSIFERGMQSADPVVKAHADQIGYLGGELAKGEIGFQEYMAAINQVILTLNQYESQSANSSSATSDLRREIINTTDAAEQFRSVVASIAGTDFAPRFSPSYAGGMSPSIAGGQREVDSMMEGLRLQTQESRRLLIEEGRANENLAREQSRLAKQTANETANAWQRAAQSVQSAWERAVGGVAGIPGVTGRSQVTELDMRLSEFGLYRNAPDEFLRRAEDQLLNNVDRGIDRNLLTALTSQSTGFDLGKVNALPNDLLAQLFGQEYESGRLFSTPLGQGLSGRLFDTGAVGAGMEREQAATSGSDFIKKLLGENLPEQFAGVASEALKGLRDGILVEDLSNIGTQAMDSLLSAFTDRTSTSPQVEAAANSIIAEFFRRYQEALSGGT